MQLVIWNDLYNNETNMHVCVLTLVCMVCMYVCLSVRYLEVGAGYDAFLHI